MLSRNWSFWISSQLQQGQWIEIDNRVAPQQYNVCEVVKVLNFPHFEIQDYPVS